MNFNLAAALVDRRLHRLGSRLLLPRWHAYQIRRMRLAYWPAYRRHQSRKPRMVVAWEMLTLAIRWRCLPFHYFRYRLYDSGVTLGQALGYLPETVFYYRMLNILNEDTILLDDKRLTHRLLAGGGVAKPALLGWSTDGRAALEKPVRDCDAIIKPARYSSGGDGVTKVRLSQHGVLGENGLPLDLAAYHRRWGDWVLEEFIEGTDGVPLRTLRVITMARADGEPRVRYIVQKLQAEAPQVTDNAHSGGLYVGVDGETGQFGSHAFNESLRVHDSDPVTGRSFAEMRINRLPEVIRLAEAAAALLPRTVLVGWDIGLSARGPVIIEGNSSPGLTNVQRTHGGIAREALDWHQSLLERRGRRGRAWRPNRAAADLRALQRH